MCALMAFVCGVDMYRADQLLPSFSLGHRSDRGSPRDSWARGLLANTCLKPLGVPGLFLLELPLLLFPQFLRLFLASSGKLLLELALRRLLLGLEGTEFCRLSYHDSRG